LAAKQIKQERMMWRIKQIFDGEYGCEERSDEEKARCVVTLENERGERRELSVYDDWLKEKHLEESKKLLKLVDL